MWTIEVGQQPNLGQLSCRCEDRRFHIAEVRIRIITWSRSAAREIRGLENQRAGPRTSATRMGPEGTPKVGHSLGRRATLAAQ